MAGNARRNPDYEEEPSQRRPLRPATGIPQENAGYRLAKRIVYYSLDVIEVLLGFRFVLKAFGANTGSPFVQLIYAVSAPLVYPFQGIFPDSTAGTAAVLEWSVLVAMVVYLVVAIGFVRFLRLIVKSGRSAPTD